jgi:ribosome-binding protein aMBF1 (putative translation factor)
LPPRSGAHSSLRRAFRQGNSTDFYFDYSTMSASNNSKIADNIKKYRNKLGISQDKLSKLADVTYNTIIKIESGKYESDH